MSDDHQERKLRALRRPVTLVLGPQQKSPSPAEEAAKIEQLKATIQKYLPNFCRAVAEKEADVIMIHQDAFAAGYHLDEYTLLGMAIKYAGLHGRGVTIHGTNHEIF